MNGWLCRLFPHDKGERSCIVEESRSTERPDGEYFAVQVYCRRCGVAIGKPLIYHNTLIRIVW